MHLNGLRRPYVLGCENGGSGSLRPGTVEIDCASPAAVKASISTLVPGFAAAFGACFTLLAAAAPAQIPFRLEGHNIVVEIEFGPHDRLPFAFDSGLSGGSIITTGAARALGLKADRDMGVRDAAGQRRGARRAVLPSIGIGGVKLESVPFAIAEIPAEVIKRPAGGSLAGFVGAPLMNDAVLCIDYSQRTLARWNRADFDAGGRVAIPMKLNHGLPTIEIGIDGRPATLIVDSGADFALTVYTSFAERNDFEHRYKPLGRQGGNGGSGRGFEAVVTEAGTVTIGPGAEFSEVPLQVIPQGMDPGWGIDGMLGFQMLKQLNPCLDADGGRLLYQGE
jgi:predicted aspartyl protease